VLNEKTIDYQWFFHFHSFLTYTKYRRDGMVKYLKERVLKEAEYYLQGYTIREISEIMNNSKTNVHLDLTVRLKEFDEEVYEKVMFQIKKQKSERHLLGGDATQKKYLEEYLKKNKLDL
jgi:putative DeoR family transcriptional regulator (stage III sporulation protein D)